MLYSLYLGLKEINDDILVSYSDIIFSKNFFSSKQNKKK